MGDEINTSHFSDDDYLTYYEQLKKETHELEALFNATLFSKNTATKLSSIDYYCGLEQEAWLLNQQKFPAPENQFLLNALNHPLLSPELALFNLEINVAPQILSASGLSKMHAELESIWDLCDITLQQKDLHLEMIGILPTVRDEVLTVENMSSMKRYQALNDQVLKFRDGKPLTLDIVGVEHLKSQHSDVMLESAATSLQLHRQVSAEKSARYYNAAILISAITVAVSANSPFLFGKTLWEETRIPLFEQAVDVGGYGSASRGPIKRVSFGSCYAKNSIFEGFKENLDHYPVLLPVKLNCKENNFSHVKMHNGTIWRWNRPIIGADEDGTVHLRIEHRVMAAGPTIVDEMANAAFFYGLQEYFATHDTAAENLIEFSLVKDNFYRAAQYGLKTQIFWPNMNDDHSPPHIKQSIQSLIKNELLACARQGLMQLNIDQTDINRYLDVIAGRVNNLQTGAFWQKKYLEKHTANRNEEKIMTMKKLLIDYRKNRLSGNPVHTWSI